MSTTANTPSSKLAPSSSNPGSSSPSAPSKHSHSHSHSGLNPNSPSVGNTSQGSTLSPNPSRSTGKLRASVDAGRGLTINPGLTIGSGGTAVGGGLMSPGGNRGRPNSEMFLGGAFGGLTATPETEAIDKWFEDLQNYEATLEEMAAASLDQNFKEELSAIEQWFTVLSEAERTAALYSLLQSSSAVQIRFFMTVLGQMARNDPMTALLSPANPVHASMEAQMEARLAQMSLKSPVPPSPAVRQFLNSNAPIGNSAAERLSPSNDQSSNSSTNNSTSQQDAANTLAQQRAKLNNSKARDHRVSAPGLLAGVGGLNPLNDGAPKSPVWQEERRSPSPEPSSVNNSTNSLNTPSNFPNSMLSPQVATIRNSGSLDDQLSPIVGGNWASMTNTPLVPMFGNGASGFGGNNGLAATPDLGQVNSRLNGNENRNSVGFKLDDARKFTRSARNSVNGIPQPTNYNGAPFNATAPITNQAQKPQNQNPNVTPSMQLSMGGALGGMFNDFNRKQNVANTLNSPLGNGLLSPQVGLQGQSWRNNNLLSPTLNGPTGTTEQEMNNMVMQAAALNNLGMLNGLASPALSPNQAMINLLAAQQQVQQLQQMQAAVNMGMLGNQGLLSPGGRFGMGMGMGMMGLGAGGGRKSPRSERSPGGKPHVQGSGANPEEELDMKLLSDVPGWLRSLRLHKYTSNFEGMTWKEMVAMDDAALEAKGVAALGARRKMLKIFEVVRIKMGMQEPNSGSSADGLKSVSPAPSGETSATDDK